MKFPVAIVLLLATAASCMRLDRPVQRGVGIAPQQTVSFGYTGGDWVGNVQCLYQNQQDCSLSIHVNGRRIDSANFRANEDVLISCLSTTPSLDLVIHNFAYSDIGDYTCLEDVTKDLSSQWLSAAPVIEKSSPILHGQPTTLTCNAPLGSPVYWVLPGFAADHQTATIVDSSNAQNASSTLTFTFQDSDHFAAYNCCIASVKGQPQADTCSSVTVVDEESLGVVTMQADTSALQLLFFVEVKSSPLVDKNTVVWQSCIVDGVCQTFTKFNYEVFDYPESYCLTSNLHYLDDGVSNYFLFTVNTTDGTLQHSAKFPVNRGSYFPQLTQQPTTVYYNLADDKTTAVLKFTINADPAPTVTWFKHYTRKESLGAQQITTGGNYAVDLTAITSTQWEATLIISPYDVNQDDAVFSLLAENSEGSYCYEADTTVGPNYLNLVQANTTTADYRFVCTFEDFPLPASYEINIVAPYAYTTTLVSEVQDKQYSQTEVTLDVTLDPQNTYFQLTCLAYNPYHKYNFRKQTITTII